MDAKEFVGRARARLELELKRAELELRRRRAGGDLLVDYGWIRLLYSGDSDVQELYYHLREREWHESDLKVFRSLVAPGQTVIDVGANLGFVTTLLASLVGHDGRVISFEPSPMVFSKLQKTIAANGLEQVVAINCGCGATSSLQMLNQVGRSTGNSSIVAEGKNPTQISVERLDDIPEVWERRVSLLKIDTEGYEPEVLEGARRLVAEQHPIIFLEMGGGFTESTLRSMRFLEENGYDIDHVRGVDWSTVGQGSDFFFLPPR